MGRVQRDRLTIRRTATGYWVVQRGGVQLTPDGTGGTILAWWDQRDPSSVVDVYAQRITSTGHVAMGWPTNGRAVCTAPGVQYQQVLVGDGASGALLAWEDHRDPATQIYAARLRADGVVPVLVNQVPGYDAMLTVVRDLILKRRLAKPGDCIVMTAGVPWEVSGSTNLIKVEQV